MDRQWVTGFVSRSFIESELIGRPDRWERESKFSESSSCGSKSDDASDPNDGRGRC